MVITNSRMTTRKAFWLWSLACILVAVQGFAVVQRQQQQQTTALFGRKKRGLGTLAADGVAPSTTKRTTLKQRSTRKKKGAATNTKKRKSDNEPAAISPDLASWMASKEAGATVETIAADVDDDDDDADDEVAFQTFEQPKAEASSGKKNRREKQSERKAVEAKRAAVIDKGIDALTAALEESNNLDGILAAVTGLFQLPTDSLKTLIAGRQRFNYRLAWVGSDDAICHVGTGLHKVPLARLQEVFLTCLGRNRLEVLEVMSVLGPFPNVKNILQGTCSIVKSTDTATSLNVVMDSMIDGTGKEILAGTEDNERKVDLQVYFADERAMVAVVPPADGSYRANPLEENGAHVLVFVKEDELDEKLDSYRVL